MKKIILSACTLILMLSVAIAQKPAAPKTKSDLREDTIQYTLGVYMMQQLLAKTGFVVSNPTLFKKAIDDVAANKPLMINPASAEDRLLAYQKLFQQEKGKKLEQLLFAKLKGQNAFTSLPSGVSYAVTTAGNGPVASLKDTVVLNIIGTLPDGTEIENTNKNKLSYMALVSEMMPGLRDVILKLKEGSIARAIIPASQAYGETGTATIPPNSALIYDIALVSVRKMK